MFVAFHKNGCGSTIVVSSPTAYPFPTVPFSMHVIVAVFSYSPLKKIRSLSSSKNRWSPAVTRKPAGKIVTTERGADNVNCTVQTAARGSNRSTPTNAPMCSRFEPVAYANKFCFAHSSINSLCCRITASTPFKNNRNGSARANFRPNIPSTVVTISRSSSSGSARANVSSGYSVSFMVSPPIIMST